MPDPVREAVPAGAPCEPKPGVPISAPCTWQEIERGVVGPRTFTLRTMAARVGEVGDLWQALGDDRQPLRGALAALDGLLSEHDWSRPGPPRRDGRSRAGPSLGRRDWR